MDLFGILKDVSEGRLEREFLGREGIGRLGSFRFIF